MLISAAIPGDGLSEEEYVMTAIQRVYWLIASIGNCCAFYFWSQSGSGFSVLLLIASLSYTGIGFYDLKMSPQNLNKLYPVVAYIRYFLESYRVEIQQYFIASDTEERPFNREQSRGTVAFYLKLKLPGKSLIFVISRWIKTVFLQRSIQSVQHL